MRKSNKFIKLDIIKLNNMYFEGKSIKKIAKHFKISESTARRRIITLQK